MKEQMILYYQNLISQFEDINHKIYQLNEQSTKCFNLLSESMIVDDKIVGQTVLDDIKKEIRLMRHEIKNQILPDLKKQIK